MPTYFSDRGVISYCKDCGECFSDSANESAIFDTDNCLSCQDLDQLIKDSNTFIPTEFVDGEMFDLSIKDYSLAVQETCLA